MSWEITPLSAFLTEREGRIKHTEANNLGMRRVSKIDFSGQIHLDDSTDTKTDMIRVSPGDLLISGINAAKGAISVHEESEDVLATIHYSAYRYDPERISVDFLKWFFKSPEFTELLKQQVSGGIKTELKPKQILPLRVRLPKLREQESIAAHLNGLQREQAKLEQEIAHQEDLVSKLKQAILQEAITGRLTAGWRAANPKVEPANQLLARIRAEKARLIAAKKLRPEKPLPPLSESEIPFAIPSSWAWCRYGDLCEYVTSGSRGWQAYYADSGALFIRAQNIKTDHIVLDDEVFVALPDKTEGTRAKVLRHDILVTITGGNLAKTALVEEDFEEAYISQHIALTRLVDTRLARWAHQALTTDRGSRSYLLSMSRGDKPGLNLPNVRSVLIPLPPLAEQTEIMARVEGLMERCRELEGEIERSRAHAAALLEAVLREAFAPSASTPATAAPAEPAAQPTPTPPAPVVTPPRKKLNQHFARAVLSAEIVHQLHAEPTFGRVKHQKIFHLCEHIARIDEIAGQYHREAAGPLDNRLIYANEGELKKQQWYREVLRNNAHGHAYVALPKAGTHEKYLAGFAEEQVGLIRRLIDLMRTWHTDRCEIFCTAYAAWNDLLLWHREPTEDAILHEILERWNPAKRRFPRERWQAALKWMREHGFAPTGFGKPTAKP